MKNFIEEQKLKKLLKEEKKCNPIVCALIVIGVIAVIAAAAYALYRYFAPQWFGEEDDEDIFDEFEEDFFEDDEIIVEDLLDNAEDHMFDE